MAKKEVGKDTRPGWKRIGLGILAVVLFILSVEVMKSGAGGLTPLLRDHLTVDNAIDSLGFGWLMAYGILSGSPVAAVALALLSSGGLTSAQTFTMITGSRLGASFVVLGLGFIYVLRGHERKTALTTGVLSFLVTVPIQLLTVPVGLTLLRLEWAGTIKWTWLVGFSTTVNSVTDPLTTLLKSYLPEWILFVLGVGMISLSFRWFDQALPDFELKGTGLTQIPRLVYRPTIMFLLGMVATTLTLSVSISLGLLVPLSTRGYIRRENLIPYILGANITTMIDTLVAGILLGDPHAMTIVVAHMIGAVIVSLPIVILFYRAYERIISRLQIWITQRKRNFAIFLGALFFIPIVLLLT